MLKPFVCNLVKHLVKGLGNFTGMGSVVPVNDNSADNIDRWIQARPYPNMTVGLICVSIYVNLC